MELPDRLQQYVDAISASGLTLYDPIEIGDPDLWIPSAELEQILDLSLAGYSVAGLPLRTRSKVVNQEICKALGYPVPKSFTKTNPRFPGQDFDKYTQKANNLQIWNEEISPTRRYAVIRIGPDDVISKVKVVSGDVLAFLDTTGTLTQKYQARLNPGADAAELVSEQDTENVTALLHTNAQADLSESSPVALPSDETFLPVAEVHRRLLGLLGSTFPDPGSDQERNRGGDLHRLACLALGYPGYADNGQFPDIRNQLTEVKLQTSPTIDLGLVTPDSTSPLDMPKIKGRQLRHCDVRYAMFHGSITDGVVHLERLYVTTGADFFGRFPQFGGKVLNKKIQIPLPSDFFHA
ncbi:restriction endonuclease [Woeseia oceani]|uniref:Restriction endonuclease n=1 Tax=Woeseia oceani TaxID=1548547 RepID=A0A193LD36_9GAMM|nr:restriction endonuclease [Woeseia oceani]ANO50440.1 restriction endonuclease [Woeseia oceani]